jgi:hypothetical protein
MYQIIDKKTQKPVGKPYRDVNRARSRRDKLDCVYGGYQYRVVRVADGMTIF